MNKTAIKNFSIWARNKLIEDITYIAKQKGVSAEGIANPLPQSTANLQFFDVGIKDYVQVAGKEIQQRNALIYAIREKERDSDYSTAFAAVIEEVAYTWFNRLIAIRFMEVNDYMPSRIRVLSSETSGKNEPDMVTTPFDTDMEFTDEEQDRIMQLKDENKLDDLFRILFIKQCNKLHEILPEMFEKTNDYTELLLNLSFTDQDGIVCHLVKDIVEEDWRDQVQIIGWLYQYYNTELKDETFALLKKNVKITKERIPAATQLFTPDWIVRYMVENSLGRLWVEGHPNEELKVGWKYYLEEAEQEPEVQAQLEEIRREYQKLNPEDIKVIDPCMGSGHILVYCFDVLMQIYESQGYTQRDAAQSIVKNNLYGLDIDNRAAQLAYFAVMMKARQYDRRFFERGITPNVYVVRESNGIDSYTVEYFCNGDSKLKKAINILIEELHDAKEYGSILNVTHVDFTALYARFDEIKEEIDLNREAALNQLYPLVKVAEVMAQKYDVVVTNPPYMGASGMSTKLSQFVKDNYPDSKSDLFAVFIEKCMQLTINNGLYGMITQPSLLFLASFERLRKKIIEYQNFSSLLHMGRGIFGVDFGSTSFVIRNNTIKEFNAHFFRLHERTFQYIDPEDISNLYLQSVQDPKYEYDFGAYNTKASEVSDKNKEYITKGKTKLHYITKQSNFSIIPGSPMAYWVSEKVLDLFGGDKISKYATAKVGIGSGNTDYFLKLWYEVMFTSINLGKSPEDIANLNYVPINKGGNYRKWYGNFEYVINWENNGFELKNYKDRYGNKLSYPRNLDYQLKRSITWGDITSSDLSFRYSDQGVFFSDVGNSLFPIDYDNIYYILGYSNTNFFNDLSKVINQTMHFKPGNMESMPIVFSYSHMTEVNNLVKENILLSRADWDSFELSWDFRKHPLVSISYDTRNKLCSKWEKWEIECEDRFNKLKTNEEDLNSIFIEIHNLQEEFMPMVEDKNVTVRKADLGRDIRSLISYAVGCMFGRYSLDVEGLAYAGGQWDDSKYRTFIPDGDNCIPITDEPYFEDDIVGRFCEWLRIVYGADTLEENLDFIAQALGNKGATSREVIRNYFLNDFIKDHIKVYQKRPIYWFFDSGKQNGFKALVYMHRWNGDTVGNVRVEYLHKMQHTYEREIQRMQEIIADGRDAREVSKAAKRKDKLQKQLKETKDYDAKLAHIALSRIDIDLDDGVKLNYEKVQTGRDGKKMQILAKI